MAHFATLLPRAAMHWRRAFRSHRPEVIHVQCFGPNGTYARVLAARYGTPLVLSAHGETLADDGGVFTRSRFAMKSLRRGLSGAAAVTGCSQVALDDLADRFGLQDGRGIVVFNGIDPHEPADDGARRFEGRYVAAVGRLQPIKGFDLLIRAFARARLPEDIRLVIGGGGPELEALRSLAEELGVSSRLILPGWLDRSSVLSLQRGALIGVVPSRFESFGIAALEMWRAGTPLIATTHGGPPEFVLNGVDGLLVTPENEQEFADSLNELVDNPAQAVSFVAAGAERVRDFTWDRVVDAYEAIYEHVVPPRQ
jgi:glycosyltransferase involved in cell wall biosynthesis